MITIIDADPLVYRAANAAFVRNENDEEAVYRVKRLFTDILLECNTTQYAAFISGPNSTSLRKDIEPSYKQNRDYTNTQRGPFDLVKATLLNMPGVYQTTDMEPDDACCILHRRYPGSILASCDKDLLQSVGKHYNYNNKRFESSSSPGHVFKVTDQLKKKSNYYAIGPIAVYYQMLVGDSADNIKGIPHVGKVTAYKLLKGCTLRQACKITRELYLKHFDNGDEEYDKTYRLIKLMSYDKGFHPALQEFNYTTSNGQSDFHYEGPSVSVYPISGIISGGVDLQDLETDGGLEHLSW